MGYQQIFLCLSKGVHRLRVTFSMFSRAPLQWNISKYVPTSLKVGTGPEWCSLMFHFNWISLDVFLCHRRCAQVQSDVLHDPLQLLDIYWCVPVSSEVCTGPEWCPPMFHYNCISINKFVLMSLKVSTSLEWHSPRSHFNGISINVFLPL